MRVELFEKSVGKMEVPCNSQRSIGGDNCKMSLDMKFEHKSHFLFRIISLAVDGTDSKFPSSIGRTRSLLTESIV